MRGRSASLRVGKGVRREAYRIGLWERPADGKGGYPFHSCPCRSWGRPTGGKKGPPLTGGVPSCASAQALAGPLQKGMRGCLMRDAGDQPKTFMSSAPDASGDRGDRRERGNPPARLFSACSRELMRISCMASRLP